MFLRRSSIPALTVILIFFAADSMGQIAVPLNRFGVAEYQRAKEKKGIVLLAINWNRRWKCAGYENAQLKSISFDRLPISKASDSAPPDMLLDDAPLILTRPGFDDYAFVVEPGKYALSSFDIKVASSIRDVGGLKASRSMLIKNGKALGGSFEVREGEIVYIGHFFLECTVQPIPWRYYPEGEDSYAKYRESIKSKFSGLEMGKAQFRLFRTTQFGNDYYADAGRQAELVGNWRFAEENYERAFAESRTRSTTDAYQSMSMYNLGRARGHLCKFEEAETLMTDALALEEKISDAQGGVMTKRLFELARFYFDRRQYSVSIPYFERGILTIKKLALENEDPIAFADLLDDFSIALGNSGQRPDADEAKKQADELRARNPDRKAKYLPVRYRQQCAG